MGIESAGVKPVGAVEMPPQRNPRPDAACADPWTPVGGPTSDSNGDVRGMRDRIAAALAFEESTVRTGVRKESLAPLHYLFATQAQLGRAEFKAMTGLGDRVATGTLSALLRRGFLAIDTSYGNVRFAMPRHALRFYFPALWPEAEQDQALLQTELKVG